jgi:hypothetical protein
MNIRDDNFRKLRIIRIVNLAIQNELFRICDKHYLNWRLSMGEIEKIASAK